MGANCSTHGEMRYAYNASVGKPKERNHSEDLSVDGKITLEWILQNRVGRCRLDASGSG
jgi:hypothetical protein